MWCCTVEVSSCSSSISSLHNGAACKSYKFEDVLHHIKVFNSPKNCCCSCEQKSVKAVRWFANSQFKCDYHISKSPLFGSTGKYFADKNLCSIWIKFVWHFSRVHLQSKPIPPQMRVGKVHAWLTPPSWKHSRMFFFCWLRFYHVTLSISFSLSSSPSPTVGHPGKADFCGGFHVKSFKNINAVNFIQNWRVWL